MTAAADKNGARAGMRPRERCAMLRLRKEILDYITTCERIQGLLARGAALTGDERAVIELCHEDLTAKMQGSERAPYAASTGTEG